MDNQKFTEGNKEKNRFNFRKGVLLFILRFLVSKTKTISAAKVDMQKDIYLHQYLRLSALSYETVGSFHLYIQKISHFFVSLLSAMSPGEEKYNKKKCKKVFINQSCNSIHRL